ncbi:MAG: hypothetical protein JOZ96_04725 [Acidobacteria bacterium]|nr:hypothetical protein [Acidobacteriota bacterium]
MKILLRSMFPCPSVDRWRAFEALLKQCLDELGHEVIELHLDPLFPPDPADVDFKIYAHKTRREVPGADLFYKEMHMRGLFTIDAEGWGADHSAVREPPDLDAGDAAEAERFVARIREQFVSNGHSKQRQPELRSIPEEYKPYLLVPLQLPTDDTIMHHSPVSVVEFVHVVSDWAEGAGQKILFKLHPGAVYPEIAAAVEARSAANPYVNRLDANIHSLIQGAEGVVVINSGTGFESLIHGKPVVTFGNCDYKSVTFAARRDNLDEAREYVAGYRPGQRLRGIKFVHHYYTRHAFDVYADDRAEVRRRLLDYLKSHLS